MGSLPEIAWFVVAVVLVLLELVVPGVILVFFGLGAAVTSLAVWLGLVHTLQAELLLFSGSSLVLLLSLRRWVRARFTGYVPDARSGQANDDDFAGGLATAAEDLSPGIPGPVEFRGSRWSALCDAPLRKGERARVVRREGLTLHLTCKEV